MDKPETKFKGSYRAEFSMGQYHYDRIARILMFVDEKSIEVNNYDTGLEQAHAVFPYYSALRTLYKSIKTLLHEHSKTKFETMFKITYKEVVEFSNELAGADEDIEIEAPLKLILKLNIIHEEMNEVMQIIGLGIIATESMDEITRIKRATA